MKGFGFLVDSKTARISEEFSKINNITLEESMRRFLSSGTYRALINPETGLYLEVFECVYDMLLEEIGEAVCSMSSNTLINPVAFLVSHTLRLYMERHRMTIEAFLAIDAEKNILGFLKTGYEAFHLTGDEGILDEVDAYVGNYSTECVSINADPYI